MSRTPRFPRLYHELRTAGRTQRAISVAAAIPETRLSAIVYGRVAPTTGECRRLSQVLTVPSHDLFSTLWRAS
jgi:hypothetical protein